MTLNQLGQQYLEQEKIIKSRITQIRPLLKTLRGNEHKAVLNRINILYSMARDCRETGDYLKLYYKEDVHFGKKFKS